MWLYFCYIRLFLFIYLYIYIYIYIWQFYPHIMQYQHHMWLYFCHNQWFLYFFHSFKNWTGQFNRELDNNLVWLCLKTRNVRKSRFSLHLWSMFYAFPNESIFSISLVYYSQNPQVPLFSNFFFKTESHGTIHIFKNYFAAIFSIFSNKKYPKRLLIGNWQFNQKN